MYADGMNELARQKARRELLGQYARLQRDLAEADPASAAYQTTIFAFRQMGYALISCGFEGDLDRLLRLRVLDGGRTSPAPRHARARPVEVRLLKQRLRPQP